MTKVTRIIVFIAALVTTIIGTITGIYIADVQKKKKVAEQQAQVKKKPKRGYIIIRER